jgi:hypothetical protein
MPSHSDTLHPLDQPWDLYLHHTGGSSIDTYGTAYAHSLRVETCEQWGAMVYHVPPLGASSVRGSGIRTTQGRVSGYSFFRNGILPEWEHPSNDKGSTLLARVTDVVEADRTWEAVLCDCGRGAAPACVTGVQMTVRDSRWGPHCRISAWTTKRKGGVAQAREWLLRLGLSATETPRKH